MNANRNIPQSVPGNGSGMAIVVIIGLGIAALNWIFSGNETEQKPETKPTDSGTENNAESMVASGVSAPIQPISVRAESGISAPAFASLFVPITKSAAQTTTGSGLKRKRKQIRPEDLATVFQHGALALTLTEAVKALVRLGFRKSAAYEALKLVGRFSAWLQFAPNGKITWKI